MRILQLITKFYRSGAESLVYTMSEELVKRKHNVFVVALTENSYTEEEELIREELHRKGIKTFCLSDKNKFQKIATLKSFIKQNGVEVIHSHAYHPNLYGRVVSLLTKVPILVTFHSASNDWSKKKPIIFEKLLNKPYIKQRLISVSKIPENFYRQNVSVDKEIIIVPNGIPFDDIALQCTNSNLKKQLGLSENDIMLLNVGRITFQKGQLFLLKVMNKLKLMGNENIVLFIAGVEQDKKIVKELINYIDQNNLKNHVKILGSRKDIPDLLKSCDVFVFPSVAEAHPIALIEAAYFEKTILASSIQANINAFSKASVIFNDMKDIDSVANEIENLTKNPAKYKQYAKNAKKEAMEKYDIKITVSRYEKIYREVLN